MTEHVFNLERQTCSRCGRAANEIIDGRTIQIRDGLSAHVIDPSCYVPREVAGAMDILLQFVEFGEGMSPSVFVYGGETYRVPCRLVPMTKIRKALRLDHQ